MSAAPGGSGSRWSGGRLLGAVVGALVLAAAALWGASRGTWLTAAWDTPLRGRVSASATGADTEPVLVAWALLALAAVAGVLATSGWGRRAVGAVVALAGVWALVRAVAGLVPPPADGLPSPARVPGRLAGVVVHPAWPVLAAVGALLLLGAGALTAWRATALPRLGARYDAPGARRVPVDTDRAMWEALDEGEDPTVAPGERGSVEPPGVTGSAEPSTHPSAPDRAS